MDEQQQKLISKNEILSDNLQLVQATKYLVHLLVHQAEETFLPERDRNQFEWKVQIVSSPVVNASCGPGGNIVIYTGLIDFCAKAQLDGKVENCASALAGVLSHEISHGVARHAMENLSLAPPLLVLTLLVEVFLMTLGLSGNEFFFARDLLKTMTALLLQLPHSRKLESEADLIACEILRHGGFPTDDFPRFLVLLTGPDEAMSTHPDSGKRARKVEEYLHQKLAMPVDENVEDLLKQLSLGYIRFYNSPHPNKALSFR